VREGIRGDLEILDMKAIDLIRWAMQLTDGLTARLVGDLRGAAMTPATPGAKGGDGNHAVWTLGHLCVVEGGIPQILFGEKSPVEHWNSLFGMGTKCMSDAGAYPSFDEVLGAYRDLRARNLKLLEELGEAGLDRVPKQIPPGFEEEMKTFGRTFLVIALHNMMHLGQIADVRRVVGLERMS
jgi:hypothetical protein